MLVKGTDYAVTYANNTAAGTATVTITGKGNYIGETEVTFEIVQKDIAGDEGFTMDPIPDQTYTGGEIEPEITVKDGDTVLVEGEDYEVSFGENTDAGTVTVTITGTGNYSGETEVTFEIVGKDIAEDEGFTIDPIPDQVYTGGEIENNTAVGTATVTITGMGN